MLMLCPILLTAILHFATEKSLYNGESFELMVRRWWKLEKDFKHKCGMSFCSSGNCDSNSVRLIMVVILVKPLVH